MKRSCVFFVSIIFGTVAIAGNAHKGPKVGPPHRITGMETVQRTIPRQIAYPLSYTGGPGDSIGYTLYDYTTNNPGSRYYQGTVS